MHHHHHHHHQRCPIYLFHSLRDTPPANIYIYIYICFIPRQSNKSRFISNIEIFCCLDLERSYTTQNPFSNFEFSSFDFWFPRSRCANSGFRFSLFDFEFQFPKLNFLLQFPILYFRFFNFRLHAPNARAAISNFYI